MALSEARLLANRENARKSTGPRTEEGKARSRRNALRHGLAGEGAVLHPEDEARLRERVAAWSECLGPRDALEEYLISRAAWHSVKLDRAGRVDAARVAANVRQAEADFAPRRLEEVARIASAIRLLQRLAAVVESRGWLDSQGLDDLIRLLGPFEPGDPRPAELTLFNREALPPPSPDQPRPSTLPPQLLALHPAPPNPPPPPESESDRSRRAYARAALAKLIALRLERLEEQRRRLHDEIASPDALHVALEGAAFDDSAPGHLRRRYETAGELGLFRILNYLERRRRRPDVEEPDDGAFSGCVPAPSPAPWTTEPEPSPDLGAAVLPPQGREPIVTPLPPEADRVEGPTDRPSAASSSPAEPSLATHPASDTPPSPPVNLEEPGKPCRFLNEANSPIPRPVTPPAYQSATFPPPHAAGESSREPGEPPPPAFGRCGPPPEPGPAGEPPGAFPWPRASGSSRR